MPQRLGHALVPALILQPLLENAVKHGVCSVPGPAEVVVVARSEGNRLLLIVENDFRPNGDANRHGMGIGLKNVRERLDAHFPGQSWLRVEHGGSQPRFRVTVSLPLRGA